MTRPDLATLPTRDELSTVASLRRTAPEKGRLVELQLPDGRWRPLEDDEIVDPNLGSRHRTGARFTLSVTKQEHRLSHLNTLCFSGS